MKNVFSLIIFSCALVFTACKKDIYVPELTMKDFTGEFYIKGDLVRTDINKEESFKYAVGISEDGRHNFQLRNNTVYIDLPFHQNSFNLYDVYHVGRPYDATLMFFDHLQNTDETYDLVWTKSEIEAYFTPGKTLSFGYGPGNVNLTLLHPLTSQDFGIQANSTASPYGMKINAIEEFESDEPNRIIGMKISLSFEANLPLFDCVIKNGEAVIFMPYKE
jgi:hypothetical protein